MRRLSFQWQKIFHYSKPVRRYQRMVSQIPEHLQSPPEVVKGMKVLDRACFTKTSEIPFLELTNPASTNKVNLGESVKILKGYELKIPKLQPVTELDGGIRGMLLNPALVTSFDSLKTEVKEALATLGICQENLKMKMITLTYENFKLEDILDAVIGSEVEGCKSYTRVGHIIHLNIRDHLLEYKSLIGQVILDKLKGIKTVVNKSNVIDNTYRNFEMELIAGEYDMITTVSENKCNFTFDFSKVYWNSRLSTEHERLVKSFETGAVIYDVCAGVGPFSVPAAKLRKCEVLANDLNPESVKWLRENAQKNKVSDRVKIYNLDGNQYLREVFKEDFIVRAKTGPFKSHIVMNLPAMAVEFLPTFQNLFSEESIPASLEMTTVHVYCFIKGEDQHCEEAVKLVEEKFGFVLGEHLTESFRVRNVAPNKEMIRVSFRLPIELVYGQQIGDNQTEPQAKKSKFHDVVEQAED